MTEDQTVIETREAIYREIVELFDGDNVTADQWLASPIRVLGNQPPSSLMGTKSNLIKLRNLVAKWQQGEVS